MEMVKTIGVVGGGQLRSGIAQLPTVNGFDVFLLDSNVDALARATKSIFASVHCLVSRCHLSTATSNLTMENVPWHADVKELSEALSSNGEWENEVACEYAHSCCVLLETTDKFKVAFRQPFSSEDYIAATPSWVVYGAEEAFDGVKIKQIACGDSHCLAITTEGQVFSQGWNQNGHLGLGTTEDCPVPQKLDAF